MNLPVVHIDCDGVLADFQTKMLETIELLTGWSSKDYQPTKWEFIPEIEEKLKAEGRFIVPLYPSCVAALCKPGWCESMKPLPGARAGITRLREFATVHVVTAPWHSSPFWCYERLKWLEKHMHIRPRCVTLTCMKELIGKEGDLFIDDKPEAVAKWNACNGRGAYVWDVPNNRTEFVEQPRLKGWDELIKVVRDEYQAR